MSDKEQVWDNMTGKGAGAGVVNWVKRLGRLRVSLAVFVQISLSLNFPSMVRRMTLSFWYREDTFHMGISTPAFKEKKVKNEIVLAAVLMQVL